MLSAIISITGVSLWHFWIGLCLLGVGWNFAFVGATTMVTQCHRPDERNKVQAFNDFLVFGSMAIGSFCLRQGAGELRLDRGQQHRLPGDPDGCRTVAVAGSAVTAASDLTGLDDAQPLRTFSAMITGMNATETALDQISGRAQRHSVEQPEQHAECEREIGRERARARLTVSNDLDRLRQPAHRGENSAAVSDRVDNRSG